MRRAAWQVGWVLLTAILGGNPGAASEAGLRTEQLLQADVVVYGGTSAGVIAAVQTARMGRTVVLISPESHPGGMSSAGLGFTDTGNKAVIGGLAREFYRRVQKHYETPAAWSLQNAADFSRFSPQQDAMWVFEPHVAEQVFEQMLAEAGVQVLRGERLDRSQGLLQQENRITQIQLESGLTVSGTVYIDAGYEGDLMAAAGVRYAVGREANSTYGETLNGNQPAQNTHNHRFVTDVDPFRIRGDSGSGLLPGVEAAGAGVEGAADARIQAYCFRLCMTRNPLNRIAFVKPDGFREQEYELLFRTFESGDLRVPMSPALLPNHKTDTNNNHAVSTDYIGQNYLYPEASYAEREAIVKRHRIYQQGLMWALTSHPRVPAEVRQEMSQWGLAADEFTDNGHWPRELYIRESRRMVSDYVVTEADCRRTRVPADPVGLGSYNMDSHNVRRFVGADGFVQNEGDVQVSPGGAYQISYRSIVPARGECENLLVPVCLSASHIAYGSIRMEPVFMILGQSSATAAVMSIEAGAALQDLPWSELQRQLLKDGQVLQLPVGSEPQVLLRPEDLAGIVLDDTRAVLTGNWSTSSSNRRFVGSGYRHDSDSNKGTCSAEWSFTAPQAGRWEVSLSWSAHSNRARNLSVMIRTQSISEIVQVDQTQDPNEEKLFEALSIVSLEKGQKLSVLLTNTDTDGYVILDAVRLRYVD